jgi:AraC-like DNA-binding protein
MARSRARRPLTPGPSPGTPSGKSVLTGAKLAAIRLACRLLSRRLRDPPTLLTLARAAHMSRSQFSYLFHVVTGLTLRDYMRDLRLTQAEILLGSTGKPLKTVAIESGFYDVPHLCRAFRERLGISPSQVRDAASGREAAR